MRIETDAYKATGEVAAVIDCDADVWVKRHGELRFTCVTNAADVMSLGDLCEEYGPVRLLYEDSGDTIKLTF